MRIDQENFRVHGTSVYGCSALSLRKQHHNYRKGVSNQEEGGIGEKGENRKKILKKKKKKGKKRRRRRRRRILINRAEQRRFRFSRLAGGPKK